MFSADALSSAVGAEVIASGDFSSGPDQDPVEQLGGIQCAWTGSTAAGAYVLVWVIAFPDGAIEYSAPDTCGRAGWEEETSLTCPLELSMNGTRISGYVMSANTEETDVEAARASILSLFTDAATAATPVPVPIPAAGAWTMPSDCPAIVAAADFTVVPGLGATVTAEGVGGRGGVFPAVVEELHGDDDLPECEIIGESASVVFGAWGGMRWRGAELAEAAGATPLIVDGLDSVLVSAQAGGGNTVDVLDGANWLRFRVQFTKNAGPIASALVAALDATGAPA